MDTTTAEEFLEKSAIRDFRLACLLRWGPEKSRAIIRDTGKRLESLVAELPADTDEKVREQLTCRLLPALAYFQALLRHGIPESEAVETVADELKRTARQAGAFLRSLLKLPFSFTIFRAVLRRRLRTDFPPKSWQIRQAESGCGFTVDRCLYKESLERYGAAALLPAFCQSEEAEFGVLEPEIRLIREHTPASVPPCGFRFYKGTRSTGAPDVTVKDS